MNQEAICRQTVTVQSKTGLHLRPISQIVEVVRRWGCPVTLTKDGRTVSADNVLDLMTLSAVSGSVLELEARGESAQQVIDEISTLFASCFDETETSE